MHLSYRWQAALVLALGLLMAILDTTIVSVVLPQIATTFHTDFQTITWVGTGYFLANAAVIPIVGYISDRIGSRTLFLIALGLFTIGSGLCVIAPTAQWLIAFRVLQGIGGGALVPVAMAIIFRLFGPTERAGAMVLLMVPLLLGPAFGPTLGGYLATSFNWNAIFTINVPIGVVAFTLALLVLRGNAAEREANGQEGPGARRFDLLGLVLSMAGFSAFVYGISRAGVDGWGNATVITLPGCGWWSADRLHDCRVVGQRPGHGSALIPQLHIHDLKHFELDNNRGAFRQPFSPAALLRTGAGVVSAGYRCDCDQPGTGDGSRAGDQWETLQQGWAAHLSCNRCSPGHHFDDRFYAPAGDDQRSGSATLADLARRRPGHGGTTVTNTGSLGSEQPADGKGDVTD